MCLESKYGYMKRYFPGSLNSPRSIYIVYFTYMYMLAVLTRLLSWVSDSLTFRKGGRIMYRRKGGSCIMHGNSDSSFF